MSSGARTAFTPPATALTYGSPASSAVADSAADGVAATLARSDHKHAREGFGAVTAVSSFNTASGNGSAATVARSDHNHGLPAIPDLSGTYLTVAAFGTSAVLLGPTGTQVLAPYSGGPTLQSTKPYSASDANEDMWQFFAGLTPSGSVKTFWLNGNNEARTTPSTQGRVGFRMFEHPEAQGYSTADFIQASTNPTNTANREALLAVRGSAHSTEAGYVVATRRFKAPTLEATSKVFVSGSDLVGSSLPGSASDGQIFFKTP